VLADQLASSGPPPTDPEQIGNPISGAAWSDYNREAYESFVAALRQRTNPGNAYGSGAKPVGELAPDAPIPAGNAPPMWVPPIEAEAAKPAEKRSLKEPNFPHAAYGGATYQGKPLTIDGDLSDWGELQHPMNMQFRSNGDRITTTDSVVYMRWGPEGLWFAWKTPKNGPVIPCPAQPYQGDGLEVWVDCDNSRLSDMVSNAYAHQFIFTPFGCRGDSRATFAEIGRNQRGLKRHEAYLDSIAKNGVSAVRQVPGGYVGEALLRRSTLARPNLMPGQWLALNFSINTTANTDEGVQWSAPKSIGTWDKPDTWGDILLLGSDGSLRAVDARHPEQAATGAAIGQPLGLEVTDPDMDLDPTQPDLVAVEARSEEAPPALLLLVETGASTGVFRRTVAVRHLLDEPEPGTIPARPGSTITLTYHDPRSAFGEADRTVTTTISVGVPISARRTGATAP
jgi:hypothetical protein